MKIINNKFVICVDNHPNHSASNLTPTTKEELSRAMDEVLDPHHHLHHGIVDCNLFLFYF
jgi:hypothetical protein